ncbi:unannotated protein [freshwater metagenome]|uniref:Unannotated protein n=1 Tax=freshwater metagenome TaxID=449393 RepID=A0A6J7HK77_9ZZZZ|nr:hypothetical protein [Actinomycetota bacterium]
MLGNLFTDDALYLAFNSTNKGTRTVQWYGTFSNVPAAPTALTATFKGRASASCTQVFAIYNWVTRAWVNLDTRAVGTTDVLVTLPVAGTLADYVSAGSTRLRVTCTSGAGSFTASGNLLRLTTTA